MLFAPSVIVNQAAEVDEENVLQNGSSGVMGSEISTSDDVKTDVKIEANNVVDPACAVLRDVEQEIKTNSNKKAKTTDFVLNLVNLTMSIPKKIIMF